MNYRMFIYTFKYEFETINVLEQFEKSMFLKRFRLQTVQMFIEQWFWFKYLEVFNKQPLYTKNSISKNIGPNFDHSLSVYYHKNIL